MGGIPDGVVDGYMEMLQPGRRPGAWYRQERYGLPFRPGKTPLTREEVRAVLEHRHHIAVYARGDGLTDYIAFDIDCKDGGESAVRQRDERYWAIRRLTGIERVPLVYRTPSGAGLRVLYRIPTTPLERLVTGRQTGLVADVLRAAGVPVLDGSIEVYPQRTQADRLPLGGGMPVLDPDTLQVLPDADIRSELDEAMVCGGLERMRRWYAAPYEDLVAHLESLPGEPLPRVVLTDRASDRAEFVRDGSRVRPSDATLRLVHGGMVEPSSRYHSEHRVALAGVLAPEVLAPFGLVNVSNDEEVAGALAQWLAERHNGFSNEWRDSVRGGSSAAAIALWKSRYLARSAATGQHFIDRVRAAAERLDGSLRQTFLITDDERREVVQLAEAAGLTGSSLYRAEVWLAASRRAVKRIIHHHLRRGVPLDEVNDGGARIVFAEIATRWMARWPYGSGVRGRGTDASMLNYVRYRQILYDGRWMRLARFSPTAVAYKHGLRPSPDMGFKASTYAVRVPRMDVRVRDVGIDALALRRVLDESGLAMSGRPVGVDEAHHILALAQSGVPVRRRYGYRLGVNVEEAARVLREGLDRANAPVLQADVEPD